MGAQDGKLLVLFWSGGITGASRMRIHMDELGDGFQGRPPQNIPPEHVNYFQMNTVKAQETQK